MVQSKIKEDSVVDVATPGPLKLIKTKGSALQRDYSLQPDDVIVAVNGTHWSKIVSIETTVNAALARAGRPVLATVVRDKIIFSVFLSKPLLKHIVVLTGDEAQAFREFNSSMPIEYIRSLSNYTILADGENTSDVVEMRKSFMAMIFPPLWLIGRRLWEPLAAFTCALITAFVIHNLLGVFIYVLMCIYIGTRQIQLAITSMQRDGMRRRMVVAARNEQEAQLIALKFNEKLRFKFSDKDNADPIDLDVEVV